MLAYILALAVGLGSFGLYMAAFFFPEVHRKNDFIWSGVGLFYALVLWVCAGRITGGVLLGQIAVVSLLGWLIWQTFFLRRQVAPVDQQTPLPTVDDLKVTISNLSSPEGRSQLTQQASRTLGQLKDGVQSAIASAQQAKSAPPATASETYVPPKLEEFGTAGQEAIERFAKVAIPEETPVNEVAEVVQDAVNEAVADLKAQGTEAQGVVSHAAKAVSQSIDQSRPAESNPLAALSHQVSNLVKSVTETVQSLIKGGGQQPDSQPTAVRQDVPIAESQPQPSQPYVRKKFREESGEPQASQPYVRKKFREEPSEAQGSQPYVRKKFREESGESQDNKPYVRKKFREEPSEAQESKPVYVRKKFRKAEIADATTATPEPTSSDVTDATIISVSEEINRMPDGSLVAEAVIEIESETLAPDLLASAMVVTSTADPNATVEDIVEELLEDISVQEEVFGGGLDARHSDNFPEAVPPHAPSPELVEAAIADAEEKGLPYNPPDVEES